MHSAGPARNACPAAGGRRLQFGDAIADAEPDKLCADVLAFAVTTAGLRLLRNGEPPDIEKIKGWLEAARSMQAA